MGISEKILAYSYNYNNIIAIGDLLLLNAPIFRQLFTFNCVASFIYKSLSIDISIAEASIHLASLSLTYSLLE